MKKFFSLFKNLETIHKPDEKSELSNKEIKELFEKLHKEPHKIKEILLSIINSKCVSEEEKKKAQKILEKIDRLDLYEFLDFLFRRI